MQIRLLLQLLDPTRTLSSWNWVPQEWVCSFELIPYSQKVNEELKFNKQTQKKLEKNNFIKLALKWAWPAGSKQAKIVYTLHINFNRASA